VLHTGNRTRLVIIMTISRQDIETVAHLARLHLSQEEEQEVLGSITSILALIDQMQAVDTANVEPLAHADDAARQRLRDDVVTETDQRDRLLQLAPSAEKGLFLVPKVIE
jgi:aspartyl-tRNA(Asn)/glutamyl-tRNA(Gln) amidotransferase subunit C